MKEPNATAPVERLSQRVRNALAPLFLLGAGLVWLALGALLSTNQRG